MADSPQNLKERLQGRFGEVLLECVTDRGETTLVVAREQARGVFLALRDEPAFEFKQLMDLCGVDYSVYGESEWATTETTNKGFSRGVVARGIGRRVEDMKKAQVESQVPRDRRFAAVYQLLSLSHNERLRVRVFATDDQFPVVDSVVEIWACANWYEREAFDLYGILFEGHPDLRRLLTDYGFVGHPFRKDFPLIGQVEMRYDAERGRIIYEPVSIEPRVLVPRVIRQDHRYVGQTGKEGSASA